MFNSIFQDIKNQINFGNNITRLIIINVVVFIVLYVVFAFVALAVGPPRYIEVQNTIAEFLSLPSTPIDILKKPWTIITHMFLHRGPFHMIFNMLYLYWFGRIFGDLMGDRRVVPLYLLSGLMGAVFYVLGTNLLLDRPATALGASAAVLGIIVASAVVAPNYNIRMILLGDIKLKYIALAAILIDLVGIANLNNTGGHFGHIGGMVMGWLMISLINSGNDPSPWFHNTYNSIVGIWDKSKSKKPKSPLKVRHKSTSGRKAKRDTNIQGNASNIRSEEEFQLDRILDKISKKGMSSLTKEEKEFLDKASKDN